MAIIAAALGCLGLALPGTAEAVLDNVADKLFIGTGKRILAEAQARTRAYTGNVPKNHDLERAIRFAELTSTLVVLEFCRKDADADSFDTRLRVGPKFLVAAQAWTRKQIGLSTSLRVIANDQLVRQLEEYLDEALASENHDILRSSLQNAETEVWKTLVEGVRAESGEEPSVEIEQAFKGTTAESPGWALIFLAFIREALKTNSRAEIAYVTTRLSKLKNFMSSFSTKLDKVLAEQHAQSNLLKRVAEKVEQGVSFNREQISVIAEIFAMKQDELLKSRIENLSMTIGQINEIIEGFLQRLGHPPVPPEELAAAFKSAAEKHFFRREMQGEEALVSSEELSGSALDTEKVVILMKGKNVYGTYIYAYLQLTLNSLRRLKNAVVNDENFMPSHFGDVLINGEGEPPVEVQAEMAKKYNMIDVPRPA